MTVILSKTTRQDSFSDYLCLSAYQANTLQSRADVARGRSDTLIQEWYMPMPQEIGRNSVQGYEVVETSLAYSLQKLTKPFGKRGGPEAELNAGLAGGALAGLASGNVVVGGAARGAGIGLQSMVGLFGGMFDITRSMMSQATDQPSIGMSNQELKYAGSSERSYQLDYSIIARDEEDVYGPSGLLSAINQLEAYSFPVSKQTGSNRDLIGTPPIWKIDHALVGFGGQVEKVQNSAPLAYIGQPRLLVLEQVMSTHYSTEVLVDSGGFTYPLKTDLSLMFTEMEPVMRVSNNEGVDYAVVYGNIATPRLACRSEIYTLDDGWGF